GWPPEVNVISLPELQQHAPEAITIPKVNQSAAMDLPGNDPARGGAAGVGRPSIESAQTTPDSLRESAGAGRATANATGNDLAVSALEAPSNVRTAKAGTTRGVSPDFGAVSGQSALALPAGFDPKLAKIELPPDSKPRTAILGESP